MMDKTSERADISDATTVVSSPDGGAVNHGNVPVLESREAPEVAFVDISDAVNDKDKVQFTVKVRRRKIPNIIFQVLRSHKDFVWLHDSFTECEDYAGFIIPPVPIKPDFEPLRSKLHKLAELEVAIDHDRYLKMKKEVEDEYLAKFKKTVNSHEIFLRRLSTNSCFARDANLFVFLSYEGDLDVRTKNKKELLTEFMRSMAKTAEEVLQPSQNETDDFFQHSRAFLDEYNQRILDASRLCTDFTNNLDEISSCYMQSCAALDGWRSLERNDFGAFLRKVSETFDEVRKGENRAVADLDLKLGDTLRYYSRESKAALELNCRRSKYLTDFDNANKAVDRARMRRRDIAMAETAREKAKQKYERVCTDARADLQAFTDRRVQQLSSSIKELTRGQLKCTANQIQILDSAIADLTALKSF